MAVRGGNSVKSLKKTPGKGGGERVAKAFTARGKDRTLQHLSLKGAAAVEKSGRCHKERKGEKAFTKRKDVAVLAVLNREKRRTKRGESSDPLKMDLC